MQDKDLLSLEQKHLLAIDGSDQMNRTVESLEKRVRADTSGSCWHINESLTKSYKMAQELDSLPKDIKVKMPFYGLTVGIKDLFCIKGMTTTAGSQILSSFISPYDSTVWETLSQKGVTLGAKLAMDEFAMGSFSNTSYLGRVSVPGFPDHSAGGSSGGSGAAVAANIVDFSVGSDTGGSVRTPAAFCSTVGYKPSYGSFSRYGMIAYASSLDQAGFLTSSLEDMEYLIKNDIALKDQKDMTFKGLKIYPSRPIKKIGYFKELLDSPDIQEDIKLAYKDLLDNLKILGFQLEAVNLPYMKYVAQIYYIIACSEASSNLAKYQGIFYGPQLIEENFAGTFWEQCAQYRSKYFCPEVQKRIMLGSFILSSENYSSMYQKAVLMREKLKEDLRSLFDSVDLLLLPTSPMTSPKWTEINKMTSAQVYLSDFMTVPFSLAGVPALSVPWYKNSNGLGIGMQWVGSYGSDFELIESVSRIAQLLGRE